MTWEQKIQMIRYFNKENYEEGAQIFLDNIDTVDEQGIDMFFTGINLTKETLGKSLNIHKAISEKLKDAQSSSFRIAMIMVLYEHLISEL